jgi:hypothetical protein
VFYFCFEGAPKGFHGSVVVAAGRSAHERVGTYYWSVFSDARLTGVVIFSCAVCELHGGKN